MKGYCSGGSWHDGRVELKFNTHFVDDTAKQMAKEVIHQAFMRLDQTILGEGLLHRPYTQLADCVDRRQLQSPVPAECLGDDGDASCGRIGSVIPVAYGYAMYGRIDNIQVLVQDPTMFTQLMDELVDAKVSHLRQATASLGALEMERTRQMENLKFHHETVLEQFARHHQDELVARLSERPNPLVIGDILADWEFERHRQCATWQVEYQKKSMNVEHEYHKKNREILRNCLV